MEWKVHYRKIKPRILTIPWSLCIRNLGVAWLGLLAVARATGVASGCQLRQQAAQSSTRDRLDSELTCGTVGQILFF
jgi:hypothetical protein